VAVGSNVSRMPKKITRHKKKNWTEIEAAIRDYPSDAVVRIIEQGKDPYFGERLVRFGAGLAIMSGTTGMTTAELLSALEREGIAIQSDAEAIIPSNSRGGSAVSSTTRTLPIVSVTLEGKAPPHFTDLRLRNTVLLSSVFPAPRYPKG
jgi:hypothetical protein